MVDTKVRTVQAQLLGRNGEVDRLVEEIAGRAGLGGWGVRPVAEGEEPNLLHEISVDVLDGVASERVTGCGLREPSAHRRDRSPLSASAVPSGLLLKKSRLRRRDQCARASIYEGKGEITLLEKDMTRYAFFEPSYCKWFDAHKLTYPPSACTHSVRASTLIDWKDSGHE